MKRSIAIQRLVPQCIPYFLDIVHFVIFKPQN